MNFDEQIELGDTNIISNLMKLMLKCSESAVCDGKAVHGRGGDGGAAHVRGSNGRLKQL